MRVLVIGLGSMGTRRVKALRSLGHDVVVYDRRPDRVDDALRITGYGSIHGADNIEVALGEVDAVIISTPPDTHYQLACESLSRNQPTFVEAGIGRLPSSKLCFPSATLRLHPAVVEMRECFSVENNAPLLYTHHCGHYLPLWHPDEPYQEVYFSRRETGACREMLMFELSWLTYLFGPVDHVNGRAVRSGTINGASIDDAYMAVVQHSAGTAGSIVIDALSAYTRALRMTFENARMLSWCNLDAYASQNEQPAQGIEVASRALLEQTYRDEVLCFLDMVRGNCTTEDWVYPVTEHNEVADTMRAFELTAGVLGALDD